jgi:hypothetical protein
LKTEAQLWLMEVITLIKINENLRMAKSIFFKYIAPVVTTRKNLNSLKKEFGDMEVEIGVMEHGLLKSLVQEQMILRDKNKL